MNICIDMRPALSRATGVGTYLRCLVEALTEIDQENHYYLFSSSWKERFHDGFSGPNFLVKDLRCPVRVLNYCWHHLRFPKIESLLNTALDVAHSPTPLVIPSKKARRVTTVHDLYFYFHPEQTVREMCKDYPALLKKHCDLSDAIISVSEYTRQQLVEHLHLPAAKVYTIHHGVDRFFQERVSAEDSRPILEKHAIQKPYFLFVGTLEPRKNVACLQTAFQQFSKDFDLVLAGCEGWGEEQKEGRGIIRAGYVSRLELRILYQNAICLIMPSTEEGFGLPLLESMAAQTPVLASRIPAFEEVAGDAFLSFDSTDPDELGLQMQKIISETKLRQELIAKGQERIRRFTWKETAQQTLELYTHL